MRLHRPIAFCRRHNDVLAALVALSRRLAGLAALPMQSPVDAARQTTAPFAGLGLWGAYVGTEFGIRLDAPGTRSAVSPLRRVRRAAVLPSGAGRHRRSEAFRPVDRCDLDLLRLRPRKEAIAVGT
ncbi:MAG: hypothetical protein R3E65_01520 [Steroidobacteraceae bacterium]